MRRIGIRAILIALSASLVLFGQVQSVTAQEPPPPGSDATPPGSDATPPGSDATPPGSEAAPPGSEPAPPGNEPAPPGAEEPTAPGEEGAQPPGSEANQQLGSISWRDILVVPRRPILKYHRIELIPTYNVSLNSPVVRAHGFGGIANFFLSETLNIGLEATYYQPQILENYFLRGLDDRVLPSANRYFWSAAVNFGYVPIYGKFALFNKWIFQWEAYIEAGLGVLQSQWIPRDPADAAASNFDVMWHIDLGTRLFLTKWLTIQVYLKDYMFVDKFEPANRMSTAVPPASTFDSRFVQNLVFGVGVGMFLPTGFEYKYTR